jgi:ABC-type uncharacterized transport system permease subunit
VNSLWDNLFRIFDYSLFYATIRSSTPILLAALAAVITQQADILNVGVEGIMLAGAFTAVAVSYFTGNWLLAVITAVIIGVIFAIIMGIAHLKFKADIFAIGMAINMLVLALTRFFLSKILGASGSFYSNKIVPIPKVSLDFLSGNKIINSMFNNYSLFEIIGIILVFLIWYILYKTVWGLRLRSVGLFPMASETAGINSTRMKMQVMIYSGILGGLAGAHLSLGYSNMFVENMTNNRGFVGVAAMFFGGVNPIFTWIGCLIFGFADSVGSRLQTYGLPSQFVLMLPYFVTILVLAVSMIRKIKREKQMKSSLNNLTKEGLSI